MTPAEIVTLGIAVGGLLLGIRSEWRAHSHDKIRLRVIPKIAFPVGPMADSRPCVAFEIVNDGHLPATVTEVGFLYRDTRERGVVTVPILIGEEKWPCRLEPHSAITVYTSPSELENPRLRQLRCAYAATASDLVFRGNSPALRFLAKHGTVRAPSRRLFRSGMPGYMTLRDFAEG